MQTPDSPKDLFTEDLLATTFYSSQGENFTNSKFPFKVTEAISTWKLPQKKKLPLYIFFGDIKINEPFSEITTNGTVYK
jgi:hypothetical protein